jgi:predicted ester cyclase
VRRAWAAPDKGYDKAIAAWLAPGWREPIAGVVLTLDDNRGFLPQLHAAFPDLHSTVELVLAEGDLVANVTVTTGTQAGRYQDLEPTHRRVTRTMLQIHRVSNGKLAETWSETGSPGFSTQLTT